jgi:hypothetical protein
VEATRLGVVPANPHVAPTPVFDDAGNVIETHEHKGEFKEW